MSVIHDGIGGPVIGHTADTIDIDITAPIFRCDVNDEGQNRVTVAWHVGYRPSQDEWDAAWAEAWRRLDELNEETPR